MSYRRKTREELLEIMHTYKKTIEEKFPWCTDEDAALMLRKTMAKKLAEFQDGLFGTMHPSDLAKCVEILVCKNDAKEKEDQPLKHYDKRRKAKP